MPFPPYPTVPSPSIWADGPVLTSQLRADVTNAVQFLANKPSFFAECTAAPPVNGSGNDYLVGLDAEILDTWGGHWPLGPVPANYYCQAPGWYLCEGYIPYGYSSGTEATFIAGIQQSAAGGTTVSYGEMHPTGNTRNPGPFTAELCLLQRTGIPGSANSDYVALVANQNSGGFVSLDGVAPLLPRLSVRWALAASGAVGLPVPSNPSWPVPPAYISAATWLNPAIRDTIAYLTYPPAFRYSYRAGSYKMPSGNFPAGNPVPLDTLTLDNYGGYSAGSFIAPRAGVYYCYGQIAWASSATAGNYSAGFSVTGNTVPLWGKGYHCAPTGAGVCVSAVKRIRVTAGQAITLAGSQTTGSPLQVTGSGNPLTRLICLWESA
jgi:hypothetical protein